jgi:FkbH-like protein
MKLTEILKRNSELGSNLTTNKIEIAVISNVTINLLKPVLEFVLREDGINAEITIGDYDSIVQDSKRFAESKAVLVFWETANFVDNFHTLGSASSIPEELISKIESEIDFVFENLSLTPLVLVNLFSSIIFEGNPLNPGSLGAIADRLNNKLKEKKGKNIILVDLDMIIAKIGTDIAFDARNFLSSKSLYTFDFYKTYVKMIKPAFGGIAGKTKKVLILDCDNTLWGGILGEDGFDGIQMSDTTPKGKAFKEVQKLYLNLKNEGVLIALCSKNNLEDVDKVIAEHPDFLLKNEDIVSKNVNWVDKATNIRQLSTDLNLGLDSFVFVDDSEFEIGLIQKELPQVKCICVPANISDYPSTVRDLSSLFYKTSSTKEDGQKTEMYKQEESRKSLAKQFNSIDDYLESLGLELTLMWDHNIPVARLAQLTQKTNQFNLTTRRYTETDVNNMLSDNRHIICAFSLSDRYGDYGVTGAAIMRIEDDNSEVSIDTFLMSCRVIGRKVEFAFFNQLLNRLNYMNIKTIKAEYIATEKNRQVHDLYQLLGFNTIETDNISKKYLMNIPIKEEIDNINFIKIVSNG